MITAIIVDDEPKSRDVLKTLLNRFCSDVEILAQAASAPEAAAAIKAFSPELLFLDIEMPGGNGLTLLESGATGQGEVIFVTSYAHYAIPALRLSAVDYLLKPIEVEDLRAAIDRVAERKRNKQASNLHMLKENLGQGEVLQKIAIPG